MKQLQSSDTMAQSVGEERPAEPLPPEVASTDVIIVPKLLLLDMSCAANEDLSRELEELRNQLQELHVQHVKF